MGARRLANQLRIGVTGSYGGLNLGDEAILKSIIAQLRATLPTEILVFSRDAEDTLRRHDVEHAVPVRDISRAEAKAAVADLDVLIFGGGGILYDDEAEVYLREVNLAHELGVPVMVYAVSAGPLRTRTARERVADAMAKTAVITVRDRHGRQLLEDIGVHRDVLITADPALLLEPEPLPSDALLREGLDLSRRLVGFSVREPGPAAPEIDVDHYHALLANAADFIVDRWKADIVFVPMERGQMDVQHSHAVISRMQNATHATVLKGNYSASQLLTLVSHFQFAVGMRLHFLIFSALQKVPFVALPYSPKVTGLLQDLGMDMPPLDDVNTGRLLAIIDQSWDLRTSLRNRIAQRLPPLQARARQSNELLLRLLQQLGIHQTMS
ncbi:MAG TPA: polysaccharide pyruvyl transferase family protein [Gammaproteobacteria bacterium]|nr:polysaccharide pyruvyl transferase family protein [Gammaproteobacteria bacterium]